MASQNRDHTPSKLASKYDPPATNFSYTRQNTDRKIGEELKDRTNQNLTSYQYQPQSKYSEVPSRYLDRQNMTLMREYESLKLKVRQLQAQNKQLEAELDKIDYEKSYIQKQFKQKLAFEEESLLQFQKQKNYQLELLQIKNEEDISKLRRQYEIQIDELQKQLKTSQYSNRQKIEQINYLQVRISELKKQLQNVERELIKSRENNSILNEKLTKEEFSSKKLQTLFQDVQRQKNQMQMQIHVLLDIEAEKSRAINALEVQLCNTEASERSLQQKVTHLTENFSDLEAHITLMKERLLESDQHVRHLQKSLSLKQAEVTKNQHIIKEQNERQSQLRQQLDINLTKMTKRQKQVEELMIQNQRLYRELNKTRHQLHQISINHGLDI